MLFSEVNVLKWLSVEGDNFRNISYLLVKEQFVFKLDWFMFFGSIYNAEKLHRV